MPPSINPEYPVYIVSKGRWDSRMTSRALEAMNVPYFIVVEEQERDAYAAVIDPAKILVLDRAYQDAYDTFDDLGRLEVEGTGRGAQLRPGALDRARSGVALGHGRQYPRIRSAERQR
jgi:hypothetical protein